LGSCKDGKYFKIAMGQTIGKDDLVDDGEWPVFSATDGDHYFGRVNDPQVRLCIGDIVIPARGNSIGSVKIVKEPATTTQTTIYCKNLSAGRLVANFVYHYLTGCKDNLFYFTQTAIPQITVEEVGSNPILIPPVAEQAKIADFLDRETAKIDELVAEQQRLIELLKEKRQAVISHAVTKGLNPHAPMKPSGIEWLGDVPTHWEVTPLKYVVSLRSGGTPSKEKLHYWNGDVPWASSKDLKTEVLSDTQDHITQIALDEGAAELVPVDSLLIVVRGMILIHTFPVVKALVPMAINQDLKALTPTAKLDVDFLAWLLRGTSRETLGRIDEAAHGTKVLRIEAWTSMELPLPPIDEQRQIVSYLLGQLEKLDLLTDQAECAVTLLQERRTALISAAVTGQIDVRQLANKKEAA
jgi:type I restriction enzyme S subunit